ncbi:TonB-dependent receptor [Patiriisocius hiemis]|uniref:Carboxypeptidase regulatory-like domain-containing protein n=1 Tax=Patiriisocius hiemis TaxID=3075604 RepID=A0ABU2YB72_9FLAO|nr:carboxypeptidase regulatory-like domain-containing protein [Constantimarinum sp. W242]MDT0555443.1 carboxypeptidase regulatory-like domain-containing protein [Constantimarinum sp. W242]
MRKFLLLISFLMLAVTASFAQGVTTSSINGKVVDGNGEPLPGSNVVAIHTPSGTSYGAITDFDGFYRILNMRVGGPYTITYTYVGFEDVVKNDIYLQLGNAEKIDIPMNESASELEEVVITAVRGGVFDSGKTGAETNVSSREIATLPSVSRGLGDFVRKTPQALVAENGSISLAGQNNRYNAIYLDGTVNNDVFGLAASGTNGGQTGVNPLSIDAIESFQINLSPFDVRQSGFSGGAINAITRSGTNKTEGSAYFFFRNQDLAGKTPGAIETDTREKLADFSAQLYGARIGGAIVEDKLFYFVNYERQDEETPQPFNFSEYRGDSSLEDINALRQGLINTFGYDPGDFANNIATLTSDKLAVRLDWNVDDKNTITAKHNYVKAEQESPNSSSSSSINFFNRGIFFPSTTNSTSLEWSTSNGSNLANNLIIGYTTVVDDRDPLGSPFPSVTIRDGDGSFFLGAEPFSTANILEQDVFTVTNNFSVFSGAHSLTFGGNFEYTDVRNVFFGQNFGNYTFNSLADFNTYLDGTQGNEVPVEDYAYGYSLIGGLGDESQGAAEFNYSQLGFYVQDDIDFTDDLKVSLGLRVDVPFFEDGLANDDFNNRTIPLLESFGKDLQGARAGKAINSKAHIAPRVGFNWDVNGEKKTQVRGGIGVFTSRVPLVWPGGAYSNNGVSQGFAADFLLDGDVFFNPDPTNQPVPDGQEVGSGSVGGNVDLFAADFKLPQTMKYNIAVDQKLPLWGLVASADFLYNDVITNVFYENLNVKGPVGTLNGADNRPFYNRSDEIDDTYGRIILGSNTGLGYSYNATVSLTKPFSNGFSGQVAYTYGEGEFVFEGTSSQNSSQWRNRITVNGKNADPIATNSQFATGHRLSANALYEIDWNDNIKTTFGVFYNGQEGNPYSFTYNEGTDLLNDDSRDNALIYVPANQSEITLVPLEKNGVIISPQEQWEALNQFIEGNEYLRGRRGKYAEVNGDRGPWNHIIDLKFLQDFSLNVGENKHTFQASLDIFNFTNLLNKDWGTRKFISSQIGLLTTESGGPDPEFTFDPDFLERGIEDIDDSGIQSSRWQIQVGLRYLFN